MTVRALRFLKSALMRGWVRLLISIALIALLLSRISISRTLSALSEIDVPLLMLFLSLSVPDRILSAYRWQVLLRHRNASLRLWGITRLVYISSFFGSFFPGQVGVELLRVYGLKNARMDLASSVSSILVERFFALFALMVLLLVGMMIAPVDLAGDAAPVAGVSMAGMACFVAAVLNERLRGVTKRLIPGFLRKKLEPKLDRFYGALDEYRDRPRVLLWSLLLGFIMQLFRIGQVFLLARALGIDVSYFTFLLLIPLVRLVTMLPISIAGLGVREVGYVLMLGEVGVPPESALCLSLMMLCTTTVANLPAAVFYARHRLTIGGTETWDAPSCEIVKGC